MSEIGTVAEIPDAVLLARSVRGCHGKGKKHKRPRWAYVADRFGLGSTFAAQLCVRFDLNPDELV
jgi:hypothetical protein